ncbi:hypothetical protein [Halococcus saccharolyticus]|uniref:Bacterio-opsin activator HTH domain-containing protein n=1 Tax=Halococcus saccharolyticus DSM 5350 TaxID=1227455 RepID=M0MHF9_9EURY|nr:hypothetical protein [Halococcus saccharolyticus]EMA44783.1 bacterio-opsin activator HTH domain-containing protein [Halococcus saccharolyticus DSM 5350]
MTLIAQFTVPGDAFVLGEVLGYGGARVEVTQFVTMGEALLPYFWVDDGVNRELFERAVRDDSRVASLTPLDGGGSAGRFTTSNGPRRSTACSVCS